MACWMYRRRKVVGCGWAGDRCGGGAVWNGIEVRVVR